MPARGSEGGRCGEGGVKVYQVNGMKGEAACSVKRENA